MTCATCNATIKDKSKAHFHGGAKLYGCSIECWKAINGNYTPTIQGGNDPTAKSGY